ncbi:MAG TPA: GAF domain-containing SpoIIE family protein phosphatase [Candidatus Acidoferrum sp.]|jgi:sigma-B regulation protein RsbU (phosphoserine phosphatase)
MDDLSKLSSYAILGDVDPVPRSLLTAFPEQAKTLTLLYEVSRELTSILDREELLRRIAERVKRIVDYHVFSVMLWNESTQLLESVFGMRYEDSVPTFSRVPLRRGLTGAAAAERRAVRVDDVLADARYIQCETSVDTRSELVVPLLLQDRLIGVLDLESTEPGAFTLENERMLATLGSYIAVALENARLYEEARENEFRLQDDLNTAREIQRQLLPHGARGIPGLDLAAAYAPARALGGDFYDFLPYGKGKLALALGDVSGKGTAAALYGSLAIGTLRELVVSSTCNPACMLQMLNLRMHGARLDARFIAMLFAVYDAAAHQLTLSNAGGPYPLLVRNGQAQEIRVEGVPLGLFPETEYEEKTIDLHRGDIVLFASDGILESLNVRQEEFGSERLHALLANAAPHTTANDLSDRIIAATDDHSGPGASPHDDRTLLVLRVTSDGAADYSKLPVIY